MLFYNRKNATDYALKWWNKTNPNYFNYDNLGGDCTNFISQCLFAGSKIMNLTKTFGWYYINANNKSPSWTGVEYFYKFIINNQNIGPTGKLCNINELEIGDIMQLNQNIFFNHQAIVTKINKNTPPNYLHDIFVTAHSNNIKNKNLSLYNAKDFRFIKILNINA